MNYKDLDFKRSYISRGEENIPRAFLNPALRMTTLYQRSVGFFSSSVFEPIIDGIVALSRNDGKIQLIASPHLNEADVTAINLGYQKRRQIITDAFTRDFVKEMESVDDVKLQLLVSLIAKGTLDIKIAVAETYGDYHDKLGILVDTDGNTMAFFGSSNSSINGYKNNYEKIRIVKDWIEADIDSVDDEKNEFNSLWNGTNEFVDVFEYTESAKCTLINVIENKQASLPKTSEPINLRNYQEEAIAAWVDNDFHGFYVMATGTGKTWTAIYSAKRLFENKKALMVVCVPYKHLVQQWEDDIIKVFPSAKIIMVSSENPSWEQQISQEIIRKQFYSNNQIIIITTIASFRMPRFAEAVAKSKDNKLLIVDEAHRFTNRTNEIRTMYQYMLGLSATPFSGSSAKKGNELMSYFGGRVFNLPIESAIENGFLVKYNYFSIFVHATEDEENRFKYHTQKIVSCFKNNRCVNPDLLVKSIRNRLRIISMATEKQFRIDEIISRVEEKDHFIVYCGDGRLFDDNSGEELRHIQTVKRVLTNHDFKSSQFTAEENMTERMELVDAFNKGEISALAAIRCLDEGINIPSIKSALILSSNDDYREFIQRRGRILRTYAGKEYATIYDVVVLPSNDLQSWAKIEFRRFHEYAKLALNWDELQVQLNDYLNEYGLAIEDIDVFDYDGMEDLLDE